MEAQHGVRLISPLLESGRRPGRHLRAAGRLCLYVLVGAAVLGGSSPAPLPETLAADLLEDLPGVEWLSRATPGEAGVACRPGNPFEDDRIGLPFWCQVCSRGAEGPLASWAYYPYDWRAPECLLSQFRAATPGLTQQAARQVYRLARETLEKRYGAGFDPGRLHEWGAGYWRDRWAWKAGPVRILLFINEPFAGTPAAKPPAVEVLARHERLDPEAEADRRAEGFARWDYVRTIERDLDRLLAADLGSVLPKLSLLLEPDHGRGLDPGTVRASIAILLRLASQAPPEKRPVYLLAADRLAGQLASHIRDDPEGEHRESPGGLVYEYSHLGETWVYTHGLLRRVWAEFPDTPWGEWAFLLLEASGWHFGSGCPADPTLFQNVIRKGEEFLERRPGSPHAARVRFLIAVAYESWWSAHRAPAGTYVESPERLPPGGGKARERAIALYEATIRDLPGGEESLVAERQLPRLKLGLNTAQRAYYCTYD